MSLVCPLYTLNLCVGCKLEKATHACAQCTLAHYCSKRCQREHWTAGNGTAASAPHMLECNGFLDTVVATVRTMLHGGKLRQLRAYMKTLPADVVHTIAAYLDYHLIFFTVEKANISMWRVDLLFGSPHEKHVLARDESSRLLLDCGEHIAWEIMHDYASDDTQTLSESQWNDAKAHIAWGYPSQVQTIDGNTAICAFDARCLKNRTLASPPQGVGEVHDALQDDQMAMLVNVVIAFAYPSDVAIVTFAVRAVSDPVFNRTDRVIACQVVRLMHLWDSSVSAMRHFAVLTGRHNTGEYSSVAIPLDDLLTSARTQRRIASKLDKRTVDLPIVLLTNGRDLGTEFNVFRLALTGMHDLTNPSYEQGVMLAETDIHFGIDVSPQVTDEALWFLLFKTDGNTGAIDRPVDFFLYLQAQACHLNPPSVFTRRLRYTTTGERMPYAHTTLKMCSGECTVRLRNGERAIVVLGHSVPHAELCVFLAPLPRRSNELSYNTVNGTRFDRFQVFDQEVAEVVFLPIDGDEYASVTIYNGAIYVFTGSQTRRLFVISVNQEQASNDVAFVSREDFRHLSEPEEIRWYVDGRTTATTNDLRFPPLAMPVMSAQS